MVQMDRQHSLGSPALTTWLNGQGLEVALAPRTTFYYSSFRRTAHYPLINYVRAWTTDDVENVEQDEDVN